jgi:hypothetical protein
MIFFYLDLFWDISFNPFNALDTFRCQNFFHPQRLPNCFYIYPSVEDTETFDTKTRHGGQRDNALIVMRLRWSMNVSVHSRGVELYERALSAAPVLVGLAPLLRTRHYARQLPALEHHDRGAPTTDPHSSLK